MKKLIGALALAAMVATSAFAEVSFGAWLCNLPTLIGSDGDGIKGGGVSNPWGGWRPARFGVNWTADDGKVGMIMGMAYDVGGGIVNFDANEMWFKPVDQIKLHVGQMDNFNGLRGDLCFGSWNWLRPNNTLAWGEGITFSQTSDAGLGLQIFPMEALQIFASLPLATSATRMDKAFGKGTVGAAYTIDGIGKIKAQFKGQYDIKEPAGKAAYWKNADETGKELTTIEAAIIGNDKQGGHTATFVPAVAGTGDPCKKMGTFEAAFDLTAVDKLFVTVGFAFTIADSDYWKGAAFYDTDKKAWNNQMKFALGASYGITEAFKVSADFSMFMFNSEQKNSKGDSAKPAMGFGGGLDYAVTDALGLAADVRMLMPNNDIDPLLSFFVGANYAVGSNGSLGLGFQAVVGMGDKAAAGNLQVVEAAKVDNELKKFIFAVPIRASIWF